MSAYLREQRRELYSKSGELQGEDGDGGMNRRTKTGGRESGNTEDSLTAGWGVGCVTREGKEVTGQKV